MPHLLLHPHSPLAAPLRGRARRGGRARGRRRRPRRVHVRRARTPAPSVAAASAVRITGAGSTFDAPFFTAAFAAYQQAHPGVAVSYAAVGSSAGITRFAAGQVGLRRHRRPRQPRRPGRRQRHDAVQVPVDLGAVVVAYNASPDGSGPLRLTGPVIARIFLGQITSWDDPAIKALNPGIELPGAYITVVHRSDGSGTTYIFSNYLSAVSPAWASAVGTGRSLRWPAGIGADGNAGVAADIARIPYSIGYTERSYVTGTDLGSGRRPEPGRQLRPADRRGHHRRRRRRARHHPRTASPSSTSPAPASYPISGYSWVLLSARQPSTASGKALTALISWLTHAGQAYAAALGYVPLPPAVQQLATTTLARVTGPAGHRSPADRSEAMPAVAFPGSKRLSRETLLDIPIGPAPTEPDGMAPAGRAPSGRESPVSASQRRHRPAAHWWTLAAELQFCNLTNLRRWARGAKRGANSGGRPTT